VNWTTEGVAETVALLAETVVLGGLETATETKEVANSGTDELNSGLNN
jgi:hypothetical protein